MFDAHVHIIDPRFPLIENNGFLPEPFRIDDYRARVADISCLRDMSGGAIVSGSFQGTDQGYLVAALAELGDGWVGVTQLDPDATDDDIAELDRAGVRATRFNLKRGASDIALMTSQALRAHEIAGWHVELYVDGSVLSSLEPVLTKLPAVSVDHLGLTEDGLPYLLDLVDRGARVKATGFGRVEMDVPDALHRIHAVSPEALMFGTDLPGTRSRRPFEPADLDVLREAVGADDLEQVLDSNGRTFYRLPPHACADPVGVSARDRGDQPDTAGE